MSRRGYDDDRNYRDYDSPPRDRGPPPFRGGGGRPPPRMRDERTSLLVRNIPRDTRQDDLRGPFERFGPIKDIYLPRDYYSGEPRGFGFVQFLNPEDAEDAQYELDRTMFNGREITVVFAEENRKKPDEMRQRERIGPGPGYGRRRSPPGRQHSRSPDYSPSPPRRRSPSPRRRGRSPPPPGDDGYYDDDGPSRRRPPAYDERGPPPRGDYGEPPRGPPRGDFDDRGPPPRGDFEDRGFPPRGPPRGGGPGGPPPPAFDDNQY